MMKWDTQSLSRTAREMKKLKTLFRFYLFNTLSLSLYNSVYSVVSIRKMTVMEVLIKHTQGSTQDQPQSSEQFFSFDQQK